MNADELQKLKTLLGPEWTEEEIAQAVQEYPALLSDTEVLLHSWQALKKAPVPPLDPHFTQRVLDKINAKRSWSARFSRFLTWPRLTLASGLVAGVLLTLFLLPRWKSTPVQEGLQIVAESQGPGDQKIYHIRLALRQPDAKSVTLAGDFSQWNEVVLKKNKQGIFWTELQVPEGTYAYGFRINGTTWRADPSASRVVPDGFGGNNSLMNL